MPARELKGFIKAGFTQAESLEILAVIAASTITNYAGTITQPPLEDFCGHTPGGTDRRAAHTILWKSSGDC